MAKPRKTKLFPSSKRPFVLVGMLATTPGRLHAQLGLLESAKVQIRTPKAFNPSTEAADHIALLVYQDCVPHLEEQMVRGVAPGSALQHWLQQAEVFLHCLRAHRISGFPIELSQVLREPQVVRGILHDTYDCVFRNDAPGPTTFDQMGDSAHQFLANNAFIKSTAARRMQAELDASNRVKSTKPVQSTPDIDVVFHSLTAARTAQFEAAQDTQLHADLLALKEREITAAKSSNADVQNKILELTAAHDSAQKALMTQIADQQSSQKALRAVAEQAKKATQALQDQLQWTRAELGTAIVQANAAEIERADLAERANNLHATINERDTHIEAIRTSTSWRITGPMRRFRRLFGKARP